MGLGDLIREGLDTLESIAPQVAPTIEALNRAGLIGDRATTQGFTNGLPQIPGTVGSGDIRSLSNLRFTGGGGGVGCPGLFAPTAQRVRPVPQIECMDPTTGRIHVWQHMGRPILRSGDRAVAKRYAKLTNRKIVGRSTGGRRRRPR